MAELGRAARSVCSRRPRCLTQATSILPENARPGYFHTTRDGTRRLARADSNLEDACRFGLRGDLDLDLMRLHQSLYGLVARILEGIDPLLAEAPPSMVLAQGDTSNVMAAAIACAAALNFCPTEGARSALL